MTIVGVTPVDPQQAARVDALVASLRTNYPKILRAQSRVQYAIAPSLKSFLTSIRAASTSLRDAGVQAGACMLVAIDAVVDAAARVDASVSVSVEISASVTASDSAN